MLNDLRRNGGLRAGRPNADGVSALAELGIEQQRSSRWQRLAAVPEERFDRWLADTRAIGGEVTEAGLFALAARIAPPIGDRRLTIVAAPFPDGTVPRNVMLQGDCLEVLRALSDNCIDALVSDPPAAISFMGAAWDDDRGGRDAWVAWMTEVASECHRVLKPGAHGLVWALPRTSHWTAWALENAGFEIRDSVHPRVRAGVSEEPQRGCGHPPTCGSQASRGWDPDADKRHPRQPVRRTRARGSAMGRWFAMSPPPPPTRPIGGKGMARP